MSDFDSFDEPPNPLGQDPFDINTTPRVSAAPQSSIDVSTDEPFHFEGWDEPEPRPPVEEIGPDIEPGGPRSGELWPGRLDFDAPFDQGQRADAEAATRSHSRTRQFIDDSWMPTIGTHRASSFERYDAGDGQYGGRGYDQSRQVPLRALGGGLPPKSMMRKLADRTNCRHCGAQREGNRCSNCSAKYCASCNVTLDEGEGCHNPHCSEYVPKPCEYCSHWPCECER